MKNIWQAALKAKSIQTETRILAMAQLKDHKDRSPV